MDTGRNQVDFTDVQKERSGSFLSRYIARMRATENPRREALAELFFAALAFLFAGSGAMLPFGAMVFGLALFCAMPRRLISLSIGTAAGLVLLGRVGLVYGFAFLLAFGLRLLLSVPGRGRRVLPDCDGFFSEAVQLRVACACMAAVALSAYQLLVGSLNRTNLLFGAVTVFSCPLLCFLFCAISKVGPSFEALVGTAPFAAQKRGDRLYWKAGYLALACAVLYSLRGAYLFGVSVSLTLAALLALFCAKRMGAVHGFLAGGIGTLVIAPLHAPAFALLGLLCGVLWSLGAFFALGLGLCVGALWSSFVGGFDGFLSIFPAQAIASVVAMPLLFKMKEKKGQASLRTAEQVLQEYRAGQPDPTELRMLKLSGAFGALSKLFDSYKEAEAVPDAQSCRSVCAEACTKRCGVCPQYDGCWSGDDSAGQALIDTAVAKMTACEPLDGDMVPPQLRSVCPDADALADDIRCGAGAYLKENDRAASARTLSLEYDMLSGMLRDAVRFERAEQRRDLYLGAEVERVLRAHGCRAHSVAVFGRRKKQFYAMGVSAGIPDSARAALKEDLQRVTKCALTDPVLCRMGDEEVLTFASARSLSVQSAVACRSAGGEVVCGDTVRFFEGEQDRFYALLSDGMGSGQRPSALSGLCASFFEKTLSAGITKNHAVKLFHTLLRTGTPECSTTLDLLELDLLSGDAVFLKAGAAPSFVARDGQLYRIRCKTIPMGLTKQPDTEKIRFHLEEGDLVVLLSDGVCQTPEDAPWLQNLLSGEVAEGDLSALCAKILSAAAENTQVGDDMTVAVMRVQA